MMCGDKGQEGLRIGTSRAAKEPKEGRETRSDFVHILCEQLCFERVTTDSFWRKSGSRLETEVTRSKWNSCDQGNIAQDGSGNFITE
eukprot:scaffold204_cov166-Alexandrium_tamarense.AAC.14